MHGRRPIRFGAVGAAEHDGRAPVLGGAWLGGEPGQAAVASVAGAVGCGLVFALGDEARRLEGVVGPRYYTGTWSYHLPCVVGVRFHLGQGLP